MLKPEPSPVRFDDRTAFRAWLDQQPIGRWERHDGLVVAMAPERAIHARIKARVWKALDDAIRAAGLPCEAFMDGMTVEVGDDKDYEPDALVNCGEPVANDSVAVPNPIVIVEVTSPSTEYVDTGSKLEDYFTLPSVQDYLLVSTKKRQIIHHSRLEPGKLLTRIFRRGPVELAPPGVSIQIAELYEGTDLV